ELVGESSRLPEPRPRPIDARPVSKASRRPLSILVLFAGRRRASPPHVRLTCRRPTLARLVAWRDGAGDPRSGGLRKAVGVSRLSVPCSIYGRAARRLLGPASSSRRRLRTAHDRSRAFAEHRRSRPPTLRALLPRARSHRADPRYHPRVQRTRGGYGCPRDATTPGETRHGTAPTARRSLKKAVSTTWAPRARARCWRRPATRQRALATSTRAESSGSAAIRRLSWRSVGTATSIGSLILHGRVP